VKRVAILQSNYIPWKGYFDIIGMVDLFVFYDDVQFTKNDWRNRNKIKTLQGIKWLSIPCGQDINRLICDVRIDTQSWQSSHWETIRQSYRKAPCWNQYSPYIEQLLTAKTWAFLSELNQTFIVDTCRNIFDFKVEFSDSRRLNAAGTKSERLLNILRDVGATHYLSGPAARSYLDVPALEQDGITVEWMDYSGYPDYPQMYPPFEHAVSVIDLIFNVGPDARSYLKRA